MFLSRLPASRLFMVSLVAMFILMPCAIVWYCKSTSPLLWPQIPLFKVIGRVEAPNLDFYVMSLNNRTDRRENMDVLRHELGLNWTYTEAMPPDDPLIYELYDRIRFARSRLGNVTDKHGRIHRGQPFRWPRNLERVAHSSRHLSLQESKFWTGIGTGRVSSTTDDFSVQSMTCATGNQDILPYKPDIPAYKLLTPARVACWHSHLSLLQEIANKKDDERAVSVIFEDDIDIERDFEVRLQWLSSILPSEWDMVFLGHCWSDETFYPPVDGPIYRNGIWRDGMHLHPSSAPQCTHAYAVNRLGARRLLLHLLYPPFAYSRTIDHAYSWLIQSKQVISYSVVPSIVVQRKIGKSDVVEGTGSGWREGLLDGVFGDSTDDTVFID